MTIESKVISLKEICRDHKLCPRVSRMLLREAAKNEKKHPNLAKHHKARTAWMWPQNSTALDEALNILMLDTKK